MDLDRYLTCLPPLAIVCFIVVVTFRSIQLGQRGIRVIVRDPARSRGAKIHEVAMSLVFWIWAVLVFTCFIAWPATPRWLPHWLTVSLINSRAARCIGAACVILPGLIYPIALHNMGSAWRIGIERANENKNGPSARSPLVTTGLFRIMRNPIYVIVDLLFIGTFLIYGGTAFLICAVLFAILLHVQILREEHFLTERFGDAYREYRAMVGRYSPWI